MSKKYLKAELLTDYCLDLKEGQKVEFELVPGRDGRMAAGELKVTE